jgi:hypothetical protein
MSTFRIVPKTHVLQACVLVLIGVLAVQVSAQTCGLSICYVSAGDSSSAVLLTQRLDFYNFRIILTT